MQQQDSGMQQQDSGRTAQAVAGQRLTDGLAAKSVQSAWQLDEA